MKANLLSFVRGLKNGTPPQFQSYLKSLTLLLVMVMSVNVWGEDCDISDDFSTLSSSTSYSTQTTTAKWSATYAAVEDFNSAKSVKINGKKGGKGVLTSPTLDNGCSHLSFTYGSANDTKVNCSIVIKNTSGTTLWSSSISKTGLTKNTAYSFSEDVTGVDGNFILVITNTSTSTSTSNTDRINLCEICITSAASSKTALDQVSNLSAGTPSATSATISWTGISDAELDGYKVEYKVKGASAWMVATSKTTETSYTLTGLTPSTEYAYQITSVAKSASTTKKDSDPKAGTNFTTDAPASREIKWYANNQQVYAKTQQEGAALTIPSDPDPDTYCYGKTFVGWTAASSVATDGTGITYVKDGDKVGSTTAYYAVFADAEGGDEFYMYQIVSSTKYYVGARVSGQSYLDAVTTKASAVPFNIDADGILRYTDGTTATIVTHSAETKTDVNFSSTTNKLTITKDKTTIKLRSQVKTSRHLQYSSGRFQFNAEEKTLNWEPAVSYSNYTTTCAPVYEAIVTSGIANGSVVISKTDNISTGVASLQGLKQGDMVYIFPTANAGYELDAVTVNSNILTATEGKYIYTIDEAGITVSATFAAKTKYDITATAPDGGTYTVQVDGNTPIEVTEANTIQAYEGAVITMTSTADDQYQLHSTPFIVKDADNGDVKVSKDDDNYTFTMPNKGVTVTAKYSATYSITAAECTNGSITKITDKNGKEITRTSQGSKVIVELSANEHYHIKSVYYIKEGEETHNEITMTNDVYSFNMVASNITVYAEFEEDPTCTVQFLNNGTPIENLTRQVYTGENLGTIKGVETALPTLSSSYAKDAFSKTFVGWTTAKIEVWQDEAPTLVSASTTVTEALELNAVWAKGDGKYQQITSESELIAGNKYVIQNDSKVIAHNSTPALIQNEVALTEVDGKLTPEARHLWTLAGSVDDGWSFVVDDTHKLSTQGSGTDLTLTGNNILWTIWNIGETQSSYSTPEYNTDDYFWIFQSDNSKDYYIEYSNSKWITYGISNTSWPTTGQNGYIKIKLYTSSLTDYITHSSASPLASITLNTDNVKKNYFVGETFTSANLSATAKLEDDIEFPIEFNDLNITPADLSTAGEKMVTVKYTFNNQEQSAEYKVNAYSVTINLVNTDRVGEESVAGNTYTWTPTTGALTFSTQAHYQFNGITNVVGADKTGSNLSYTLSNPTTNVTLTATWQRLFTLTYNGKGGSTPAAVVDKPSGTEITLSTPTWTGYDFVGWFDNEAYEGDALTSPYSITADAEIFAKWSEIMPNEISLSPNETAIELIYDGSASEKAKKITATVNPSTALVKTFEWSVVEGGDFVEVADDGTITAKAAGTAKVKVASTRDANIYKEISVTVHALPQITWLNMDGSQFGETTKGTSAGKVGTMPSGTPESCDAEKYPYFRGWSKSNFGKTTDNPEANFVTKDTEVALDGKYTFYAVCAAGAATGPDEEKTTTLTFGSGAPGSNQTWTDTDGSVWTYSSSNITWSGNNLGFPASSTSWVQVQLPNDANSAKKVDIVQKQDWGSNAKVNLTGDGISGTIATLVRNSQSYSFTSENKNAGTYKLTNAGSQGAWISNIKVTYNVKSIEYTLWATQCCQAPEHELAITTTALTVKMDNTLQLSTGETGNGNTIKWESKNTAIAMVDQSGLVTPVGTGKVTITVSQEAKTVDNVDFCEQYAEVEVEVIANNEFGISFTAAEGGSAVAKINDAITQKATTGTTVTIVATESSSDYIFDGWTVVSGGVSLTNTTANPTTFEMGSAEVEITPTFYKKTVDNIAIKTTPSVTSYTTRDHLNVTGLVITANYTKHGSEDIAYAGNEDKFSFSPALDANLTAGNQQDVTVTYDGKSTTFKIDVAQYTTPYYSLVTDASQLVAGKKVVFGTPNANVVMGYWVKDKNNISAISADYNEEHTAIEVDGAAYVIGGDNTTGFTFRDGNDLFIYAAGNNTNNYMKAYEESNLDDNGKWSISISDNEGKAEIICKNSSNNYNKVCYNASSTIFSCYKNAQQEVQIFIEDVKPEYVPVTSIELNETAMNVMQSKSGSLVATIGPDNATQHNVTWSIINDNANGKITVTEAGTVLVDKDAAVGATATVRATTDGTDKDGNHLTAECVITVTELETIDYMLVTTASLLQAGDIIVLGNADNSVLNGAIGTGDYFDKVQATYNSAKKTMSSKYAVEITLGGNAIDGWTFTTYEGNIIADASEDIEVSTTKDPSVWTIAIAADGTATIKAEGEGYAIRYNTTAPRFKRYQQGSGATIQIYSKRDTRYKRTDLVVGNYGTLCVPYAVKATDRSGATFWNIETSNAIGYTNPSSVTIVEEEGDLVAGKPYIFCATETEMAMFFSGDKYEGTVSVPANGLFGNLTDGTITINPTTYEPGYFFVLQQKLYECGVNCTVAPNRGWVQAADIQNMTTPSPAPRRVIGNPNGTPTGINNLNSDGFKNIEGARKYFHNNQIMIVNEGRIYNAQGIEVQ